MDAECYLTSPERYRLRRQQRRRALAKIASISVLVLLLGALGFEM
jgi:hypothetical protein